MKEKVVFYMTGNLNRRPGVEYVIFRAELAPEAGNSTGNYSLIPGEYIRGNRAWGLGGYDHHIVFQKLARYFNSEDLRKEAEEIEGGKPSFDRPEHLRRLADEIEKVVGR